MFPLHENTVLVLVFLLVGACIASFTAMRGRVPVWELVFVLLISLAWPWPIALNIGLDHYAITMASYLSFLTFVAVACGSAWGLVARRLNGWVLIFAAAIAPSVTAGVYMIERQRVPNAPCSVNASFEIGGLTLVVPREMGARSATAEGAPEQQ
jgi:hypothetical protein